MKINISNQLSKIVCDAARSGKPIVEKKTINAILSDIKTSQFSTLPSVIEQKRYLSF